MATVVCDPSLLGVPVSPAVGVGWASFDPCVVLGDMPLSSKTAISKTTNGREVRVALRFAAPPTASYVHLDSDDSAYGQDPTVVAADGDLLLINMSVNNTEGVPSWSRFLDNFFVCKADPERPWLEGLPSFGNRVCNHTGIFRCGAEDFFVADLRTRADAGEVVVAELFRYSSATKRWDLKRLDLPAGPGLDPLCWDWEEADAVFAFRGLMCWADYHRGVLFCDVSADHPELRFVRFPGIEILYDFSNGRGPTDYYRTAAVSQGRLWFVDVDDGCFRRTSSSTLAAAACTVTTWTLRMPELEWVKEHTLHLSDLWSHWKYRRSPLPRSVPWFPIVDMQQAHVLHFVVRESVDATMHWTITVDMKNGCLMAYAPYQNDIEQPEADVDVSNMFGDIPLVCCKYN